MSRPPSSSTSQLTARGASGLVNLNSTHDQPNFCVGRAGHLSGWEMPTQKNSGWVRVNPLS